MPPSTTGWSASQSSQPSAVVARCDRPAPARRSRPGRRAGSSGCRGRCRCRRSRAVRSGKSAGRLVVPQQGDDEARGSGRDLDDDEDADVEPERVEDVGERVLELVPVEERLAGPTGQPGLVSDSGDEAADDDDRRDRRDRLAAPVAGPPARWRARPPVARLERTGGRPRRVGACVGYSSTGALVLSSIQVFSISASSPVESSSSIAAETQSVSGESLASSAPHSSPPGAGNWPTISPSGHLDRGQVEGGRDVDDDRVDLTVLERRGRRRWRCRRPAGRSLGWIEASTASRLVVPIWTPIVGVLEVGQRRRAGERRSP